MPMIAGHIDRQQSAASSASSPRPMPLLHFRRGFEADVAAAFHYEGRASPPMKLGRDSLARPSRMRAQRLRLPRRQLSWLSADARHRLLLPARSSIATMPPRFLFSFLPVSDKPTSYRFESARCSSMNTCCYIARLSYYSKRLYTSTFN